MINKVTLFCFRQYLVRNSVQFIKRRMSTVNKSRPEEVRISIPFGHIAGELWNGSGTEIPILAVHGWLDNAGTWDTLLPLINKNYPVLAIDIPGHGMSSPRPTGVGGSFIENVITLDRVINYFKWEKVILMGHSMGGSINTMYAGTVPEKISQIIFVDGGIPLSSDYKDIPKYTAKCLKALPVAEAKLNTTPPMYTYDDIVEKLFTSYKGQITMESAKFLLRRGAKKHSNGLYSFTFSPLEKVGYPMIMTSEAVKSYCSRIDCDVLLLKALSTIDYGEKFRRIFMEGFKVIKESAKSFEVVGIKGAHHAHLNNPIPVADAINRFLVGHPQNMDDLIDISNESDIFLKDNDIKKN